MGFLLIIIGLYLMLRGFLLFGLYFYTKDKENPYKRFKSNLKNILQENGIK